MKYLLYVYYNSFHPIIISIFCFFFEASCVAAFQQYQQKQQKHQQAEAAAALIDGHHHLGFGQCGQQKKKHKPSSSAAAASSSAARQSWTVDVRWLVGWSAFLNACLFVCLVISADFLILNAAYVNTKYGIGTFGVGCQPAPFQIY